MKTPRVFFQKRMRLFVYSAGFNFLLLLTFDMFGEGQKQGQHEAISEEEATYVVCYCDSPAGGISEVCMPLTT